MQNVRLVIQGVPVAKARARTVRSGGRTWSFTPRKTADAEEEIARKAKLHFKEPLQGPLNISVRFVMPIPSSLSKKKRLALDGQPHIRRPDNDNLFKTVADALNGIAYVDDSQLALVVLKKEYGTTPLTDVEIRPLT